MFGKNPKPLAKKPFSQTQPESMQHLLTILPDGGNSKFRTSAFQYGENGALSWLTARKLPGTNDWTITRYIQFGAGNPVCTQEDEISDICFFDALHYCAVTEHLNELQKPADEPAFLHAGIPHLREAAKNADIPLDDDMGLPYPAVDGFIIGDGVFSKDAYNIAARTEGKILALPPASGDITPAVPAAGTLAALKAERERLRDDLSKEVQQLTAPIREEEALLKEKLAALSKRWNDLITPSARKLEGGLAFDTALIVVRPVTKMLREAMNKSFGLGWHINPTHEISGFKYAIALAGDFISQAFFFKTESESLKTAQLYARSQFDFRINLVKKTAPILPEGNEKRLFEAFARAAEGVFELEKAAMLHTQHIGKKHGRKNIEEAIKIMGLDEQAARTLRDNYNSKSFPKPGAFISMLEQKHEELEIAFEAKAIAILKEQAPLLALPAG